MVNPPPDHRPHTANVTVKGGRMGFEGDGGVPFAFHAQPDVPQNQVNMWNGIFMEGTRIGTRDLAGVPQPLAWLFTMPNSSDMTRLSISSAEQILFSPGQGVTLDDLMIQSAYTKSCTINDLIAHKVWITDPTILAEEYDQFSSLFKVR